MILSIPIEDFNIDYIHYTKSKKNILMNGLFTKILYSDSDIVLNGLFLRFTLQIKQIQNQWYYLLDENNTKNQEIIKLLAHLENDILLYYKIFLHKSQLKSIFYLKNQLEKGSFKFKEQNATQETAIGKFSPSSMECIMKISGVWQNESQIGLNFKIVSLREPTVPLKPLPL